MKKVKEEEDLCHRYLLYNNQHEKNRSNIYIYIYNISHYQLFTAINPTLYIQGVCVKGAHVFVRLCVFSVYFLCAL